jgi:hypothetical protein
MARGTRRTQLVEQHVVATKAALTPKWVRVFSYTERVE